MENEKVEAPQEQPQEEIVPATVFSFGPEEGRVDAGTEAEAAGEEAPQDSEQVVEPEGSDGVDTQLSDQARINQAIGREKARIRQKYEQDDA